ncbi:MAG: succinate dehydrogenase, hydrophobic membrane anchor protein [Pseudomonadota bacterium]
MNQHLSGLPAWLVQRLSALYMLLFTAVAGGWLLWLPLPSDYPGWRALMANPVVGIATAMFVLALLLHAWVGVRDVILDYAGHHPWWRLGLLGLLGGWLIALALWSVRILLMGMGL